MPIATVVVDASALAAILFREPAFEGLVARLDGKRLCAPTLLPFELANICVTKSRRDAAQQPAFAAALALYADLDLDEQSINADDVAKLALSTGLSAYDASYLWLARQIGAELVTLDKALLRAASRP